MHDHLFRKIHTKSWNNFSPLYPAKEKVDFRLEKPQLYAIGKLKLLVTTTQCLNIFNCNIQTRLKIDPSSEGLGNILEQNHRILTTRNGSLLDMYHNHF